MTYRYFKDKQCIIWRCDESNNWDAHFEMDGWCWVPEPTGFFRLKELSEEDVFLELL